MITGIRCEPAGAAAIAGEPLDALVELITDFTWAAGGRLGRIEVAAALRGHYPSARRAAYRSSSHRRLNVVRDRRRARPCSARRTSRSSNTTWCLLRRAPSDRQHRCPKLPLEPRMPQHAVPLQVSPVSAQEPRLPLPPSRRSQARRRRRCSSRRRAWRYRGAGSTLTRSQLTPGGPWRIRVDDEVRAKIVPDVHQTRRGASRARQPRPPQRLGDRDRHHPRRMRHTIQALRA